jgi:hypothetical protein
MALHRLSRLLFLTRRNLFGEFNSHGQPGKDPSSNTTGRSKPETVPRNACMATCLVILMFAPTVTIIAFELLGYRQHAALAE